MITLFRVFGTAPALAESMSCNDALLSDSMNFKNGISRQEARIILEHGMCGAALYNSPEIACTFGASAPGMPVALEGRRRNCDNRWHGGASS